MVSKTGETNLEKKLLLFLIFTFFLIAISFSHALPFRATLGTGKVVLRPEVMEGERKVIERELRIINRNDYSISAKLVPSEGIKDVIEIIDGELELAANEEKDAKYRIILEDTYSYSGRINVVFSVEGKQAGIVLSYVIDIIGEKGLKEGIIETDQEKDLGEEEDREEESDVSFNIGLKEEGTEEKINTIENGEGKSGSYAPVLTIITIVLILILAIGGIIFLIRI